jgi:hypothetical protein
MRFLQPDNCLHLQGYRKWDESGASLYMQGDIKDEYSETTGWGNEYEGPTQFDPEDEGSKFLRNAGIRLQDYTLSQRKGRQYKHGLPYKPEILYQAWLCDRKLKILNLRLTGGPSFVSV